jgi:iron complex outermembrane receptor protein
MREIKDDRRFMPGPRLTRLAAAMLLALPLASLRADENQPEADEREAAELDRITVTGTRIKRVDVEGALPVTVIDREMIELSGEASVADVLRNLTFNSFGSFRTQSGNYWQGTSTIDLRGIGPGRTLVLLDGRRLPKAPISGQVQDINIIPLGAVERIEVLSDGASAIYGSDAIGGVVNIITRDDYDGWQLEYGVYEVNAGGGERDTGTVMYGHSNSDTRLIAVLSWNNQDISYQRDFDWYREGASLYSNNFTTVDPDTGNAYFNFTAIPGACDDSAAFYQVPDERSLTGQRCAYDFALVSADESSIDTAGLLLKAEHEFAASWTLWANLSWTRTDSFGRYAPLPDSSFWTGEPIPVDSPNNPTNPASPMYDAAFGPNVPVHIWHRFDALGPRDALVDSELKDLQFGVTGWLGPTELDTGVRVARQHTDVIDQNYVNFDAAWARVRDGSYDLMTPTSTPPEVVDQMTVNYATWADYDQNEVFATLAWDLFDIGGRPVQWVVGGEYREEYFKNYTDWPNQPQLDADRDIVSLYFETLLSVTPDLEVSLAGRYDDYSDWGSNFAPKVALRWRATDQLMLRGSWGEGFRAPDLYIMSEEGGERIGIFGEDPQTCAALGLDSDCLFPTTFRYLISPEIAAEQSKQWSLGVAWQPTDALNLTVDYYDISMENEIRWFGASEVWVFDIQGLAQPPGFGVTRDPVTGQITLMTFGWGNLGFKDTSGVDFNAQMNFEIGPGRWDSNLQVSRVFEARLNKGFNWVGLPGYPEMRATLSNSYNIGDFTLAWNTHYIADQKGEWADFDAGEAIGHVPSWVTHDLQLVYHAPWDGTVTVGAQNAFDKKPPLGVGDYGARDYDFELYDGWGRIVYLRYRQEF